ncbi:hypothetical protein GL50803_005787 [Giardia duodenalis]|uniref:Uncharacterized protein n=1 Tax=Giardia intestinalis (strain ATCC 50803 / WB clone C6) TaxID=184922 RepID=D3KG06_GIAIC|nr:hypothetical protein GL50803_005787 [Giardia intestinalis]KAE8302990.1 hypothetical protein GL50803_005787 [Giardia intestinalis]
MILRDICSANEDCTAPRRRTIYNCPLLRRYYLKHPSKYSILGILSATITIQRLWRLISKGLCQRCPVVNQDTNISKLEAVPESRQVRISLIAKFIAQFEAREQVQVIALSRDARAQEFSLFCATRIQQAFRLKRARIYRAFHIYPIYKIAASCILFHFQTMKGQGQTGAARWAARVIQSRYRGNLYRRVFLHLQAHIAEITRQTSSSPMQLLRNLDPTGARNLEALAEDFVIRFRLGTPDNAPWPPRLYWKVFLKNQHVCDVSITAPRNYSVEQETGVVDKRLWYHRITNNPWRLIDPSITDSIVQSSAAVMRPVFHSRGELEKLRRAKRLAWMREMRKISILRDMGLDDLEQIASSALQHDPSLRTTCSILLDDTPTSLEKLSQSVQSYATSVNDESVDDLLRWSGTLDYDKYSDDWLATGVTITQREMNNSSSLESSKLSVLGIPGHRPGAPLRYSASVLNTTLQRIQERQGPEPQ